MTIKDKQVLIERLRQLSAVVSDLATALEDTEASTQKQCVPAEVTAPDSKEETPAKEYTYEEARAILAEKVRVFRIHLKIQDGAVKIYGSLSPVKGKVGASYGAVDIRDVLSQTDRQHQILPGIGPFAFIGLRVQHIQVVPVLPGTDLQGTGNTGPVKAAQRDHLGLSHPVRNDKFPVGRVQVPVNDLGKGLSPGGGYPVENAAFLQVVFPVIAGAARKEKKAQSIKNQKIHCRYPPESCRPC
jgi:hypothetical protein